MNDSGYFEDEEEPKTLAAIAKRGGPFAWRVLSSLDKRSLTLMRPERLAVLKRLLDVIELTVQFDDDELWEKLQRAHDGWYGVGDTIQERRRRIVEAIDEMLRAEWRTPGMSEHRVWSLARVLVAIEPAFGELATETLGGLLDDASKVRESGKTAGKGNIGPHGVAARLSVACSAFGDDDLVLATRAFRDAFK